jgi:hypothetical protein
MSGMESHVYGKDKFFMLPETGQKTFAYMYSIVRNRSKLSLGG